MIQDTLEKALNNLKLKSELELKSIANNKTELDIDSIFTDFEKYFKYKEKINRIHTEKHIPEEILPKYIWEEIETDFDFSKLVIFEETTTLNTLEQIYIMYGNTYRLTYSLSTPKILQKIEILINK